MKVLFKKLAVLLTAAVLIFVDQLSKDYIYNLLKTTGRMKMTVIPGLLEFSYLENPAAAFGLFGNVIGLVVALTLLVAAGIVAALFLYKSHSVFSYIASALLLAGGLGNLIDRMTLGYVVDFIHVMFFGYIFNVADCCVTIGALCLVAHYIVCIKREKTAKDLLEKAEPKC